MRTNGEVGHDALAAGGIVEAARHKPGNCGANGPQSDEKGFFYLKPEDAAAAWNRRAGA